MSAIKQQVIFDMEAQTMRELGEDVARATVDQMWDVDDQRPLVIQPRHVAAAVAALSPADIADILTDEIAWATLASDVKAVALRRDVAAAEAIADTVAMIIRKAASEQLKDAAESARYDLECERFGLDLNGQSRELTGKAYGAAL